MKSTGRSVSDLKAHLVLTTKYRRNVINQEIWERLNQIIKKFCEEQGCSIIEINCEADHLHMVFQYYPQLTLSKFVNSLKTVTSRLIRKEFPEQVTKFYYKKPVFWNGSYYISSCGGATIETLKKYVQSQKPVK